MSPGFQVLRFANEQVMSNLEGVVEVIRQTTAPCMRGLPPSPTLPHKGGGSNKASTDVIQNTGITRGSQP